MMEEVFSVETKNKSRFIWKFTYLFVSLHRERWNQVEPRCAERWHGCGNAEMMSNSTLPLGFFHSNIAGHVWPAFYIFRYLGSVNSAESLTLVAVMKFTCATNSRLIFIL